MGHNTDADPACTPWEVSPSLHHFFHASSILSLTSLTQQTSHVPSSCPCSLELCWWLNDSCYKNKWCLPLFALLHSLSLHFCFHHYCFSNLSSTSYITAIFMLASGHLGLEIKILYYCALHSTAKHLKAQPRAEAAGEWCQTWELTYVSAHVNAHSHLRKFEGWRFICKGITVKLFFSTLPKTPSPRFNSAPLHRGWVLAAILDSL